MTEPIMSKDIMLPEAIVNTMARTFSRAWIVNIMNTNHYSILFQPAEARDRAIMEFLA